MNRRKLKERVHALEAELAKRGLFLLTNNTWYKITLKDGKQIYTFHNSEGRLLHAYVNTQKTEILVKEIWGKDVDMFQSVDYSKLRQHFLDLFESVGIKSGSLVRSRVAPNRRERIQATPTSGCPVTVRGHIVKLYDVRILNMTDERFNRVAVPHVDLGVGDIVIFQEQADFVTFTIANEGNLDYLIKTIGAGDKSKVFKKGSASYKELTEALKNG